MRLVASEHWDFVQGHRSQAHLEALVGGIVATSESAVLMDDPSL